MKFEASAYADKFGCHVKTILRAATGEPHPSDWDPKPIDHYAVADAFGMKRPALLRVMQGEDTLIDVEAAAKLLEISVRRFHQRRGSVTGYDPAAEHGRIVRYLKSNIESIRDDI